jgi:hypothetical protein
LNVFFNAEGIQVNRLSNSLMMKIAFVLCLSLSLSLAGFAQLKKGQVDPSKVPAQRQHYLPEYTFDAPSEPGAWKKQKPGLNVSFATTDELFLRSEVPVISSESNWQGTAWKGERLNAQILVWSPDTLRQVRVEVKDLADPGNKVIKKENIKVNLVRYVLSNFPYGARALNCGSGVADSVYLMPDRFETFERFELPGGTTRPLWVTIELPDDIDAGVYHGAIEVSTESHHQTLNVTVNVQDQTLPKPTEWKFRLDLWQNPWVVATYYQVEPWSDEHISLLKKHLKLYADAGGKYITTYAVHSPWSDNSYEIEGAMIDWVKQRNGSWKFGYSIFDQYVQLCMDLGIREAITIYTPVPWGHRFRYLDEASGNYVYAEWSPETPEFKAVWNVFLDDLKAHLTKKGWLDKTYLGINENPLNITLAAAKVIKDHSQDWKITYAGDWHPELTSVLDDYSPVISSEPSMKELQERKSKGFTTTYYVCCTPAKPNNFVFSPPLESTYIGWYSAAYGYDGFLRWAYDAWPADPMRDARHTFWPAGDCFLVYPGGASSIRFEKLREGIVDFEKLRILRAAAGKSNDKKVKGLLQALDKHLTTFIGDRDYSKRAYNNADMKSQVLKGKKLINDLSVALLIK